VQLLARYVGLEGQKAFTVIYITTPLPRRLPRTALDDFCRAMGKQVITLIAIKSWRDNWQELQPYSSSSLEILR